MKTIRKPGGGRTVAWLAAVLAALTLLGAFAALIPRSNGTSGNFTPYGSTVELVKMQTPETAGGRITAATYADGKHVMAVDKETDPSAIYYTTDGKTWTNALADKSTGNYDTYAEIVDEVAFSVNNWFFATYGWNSSGSDGFIFRFTEERQLGGAWTIAFSGANDMLEGPCNILTMEAPDGANGDLYVVTSNGYLLNRRNAPYSFMGAVYDGYRPFVGYSVFDLDKLGDTYLALGEDASGRAVLFTATDPSGTWTPRVLGEYGATRLTVTDDLCVVACDDGRLAYTSDLSTWKYAKMPDNVEFSEFFSFGDSYYAIANKDGRGMLYESTNGVSWERVAVVDELLTCVSSGPREAFLYGVNGGVYRMKNK